MNKDQARQLLKEHELRVTGPRLAVVLSLAAAQRPLSYSEVLAGLGETDWDDATIFRNLVKLREAGVAPVVSKAEGIDRYALSVTEQQAHRHPHFLCDICGKVACLPDDMQLTLKQKSPWASSVRKAAIQLNGECPDCLDEQ